MLLNLPDLKLATQGKGRVLRKWSIEKKKKKNKKKEIKGQGDKQPRCPLQEETVQNHKLSSILYLMSHVLKTYQRKERNKRKTNSQF